VGLPTDRKVGLYVGKFCCTIETEETFCVSDNLLGRHPYNGRKSRKAEVTQGFHPIPFTETGLCNKLEKNNLKSNSRDRIFRVSDKLRRHDVLSPKNKDR
jgi:hypothetical protein